MAHDSGRIFRGDDRRRLVPEAVVLVLQVLLDELEDAPDYRRTALLDMQRRMRVMYGIPAPRVDEVALAQALAEEDGIPVED